MTSKGNNNSRNSTRSNGGLNSPSEVKHVSDIIGDWGLWQTNIAIFCTSVAIFSSFNGMVPNFYQPRTSYKCIDDDFVSIRFIVFYFYFHCYVIVIKLHS